MYKNHSIKSSNLFDDVSFFSYSGPGGDDHKPIEERFTCKVPKVSFSSDDPALTLLSRSFPGTPASILWGKTAETNTREPLSNFRHKTVSACAEQSAGSLDCFMELIKLDEDQIWAIERATKQQSGCAEWFEFREGRLTASQFAVYLSCCKSGEVSVTVILVSK